MSSATGMLRVVRSGAVARLTLERAPVNALDRPLSRALADALSEISRDSSVAALVLDGAGRGFSAGVEVGDHVPSLVEGMLSDFHSAVRALAGAPFPTLAAVHGFALGGGLELALACDLVVAEADARLGFPEIRLGAYPPVAAAVLPARIGWAAACELVLGGEELAPERAAALGLVNRVCAPGAREDAIQSLLGPLLAHSPAVVRAAKAALREGASRPASAVAPRPGMGDALERIETRYLADLVALHDAEEGVRAWLEKRPPMWGNR